jgi:hypothetical protein
MRRMLTWIARGLLVTLAFAPAVLSNLSTSEAQARGAGGRTYARGSVHSSNTNVNRNVNVNNNVNVNRNVNVNNNVGYDRWGHPVARAAAFTATAIAVGTVVASLPPHCSSIVTGSVTYQNCGGTYYQPVYHTNTVQYVVVDHP